MNICTYCGYPYESPHSCMGSMRAAIEAIKKERDMMYDLLTGDKQKLIQERDEYRSAMERLNDDSDFGFTILQEALAKYPRDKS